MEDAKGGGGKAKMNREKNAGGRGCNCLYCRGAKYLLEQAAVTTMNEYEVIGQKSDVSRYLLPRLRTRDISKAKREGY
jgi:hypothetical protein